MNTWCYTSIFMHTDVWSETMYVAYAAICMKKNNKKNWCTVMLCKWHHHLLNKGKWSWTGIWCILCVKNSHTYIFLNNYHISWNTKSKKPPERIRKSVTSDSMKGFSTSFNPEMWKIFPANARSPVANVKRDLWHDDGSKPVAMDYNFINCFKTNRKKGKNKKIEPKIWSQNLIILPFGSREIFLRDNNMWKNCTMMLQFEFCNKKM